MTSIRNFSDIVEMPVPITALCRIRNFYTEITVHYEHPLVGECTSSATYKIWKRDANLRLDSFTSTDGSETYVSYLFLANGDAASNVPPQSLLKINHTDKTVTVLWSSETSFRDTDIADTSVNISKATLAREKNWMGREKTENVGDWKSKVYTMNDVIYRYRSHEVTKRTSRSLLVRLLEGGFPSIGVVKKEEYERKFHPSVWLTEDFPLKMKELLPLLDIVADDIKVAGQLREVLTTTFPDGTFPVKIALSLALKTRLVMQCRKFIDLTSTPAQIGNGKQQKPGPNANAAEFFATPKSYTWNKNTVNKKKRKASD